MKCPNCGAELNLALVMEEKKDGAKTSAIGKTYSFRIAGKPYSLSDGEIVQAGKDIAQPETIRDYYVELSDSNNIIQEYPVKQVVRKALHTKYTEKFSEIHFNAQRARQILSKLGFTIKKK